MENVAYPVTVIIPAYNAQRTLARAMDSLFAQTMPQEEMEIILIDDGSTDATPGLCDQYAAEHGNVRAIHQENQGVSAARNAGIRAAKGKYLMYLDGDDALSPETVENVVSFFEQHYDEVDLVTYPLCYNYADGTTNINWKYKANADLFLGTGVYSLVVHPMVSQSTMNICVKKHESPTIFETTMTLCEDQLYNTTQLSHLAHIGFVREARYDYFKDGATASTPIDDTEYFVSHITFFVKLLNIRNELVDMCRYCENLILYNLSWLLPSRMYRTYWMAERKREQPMAEFFEILDRIPNRSILEYKHMNVHLKYYLLSLKKTNRPRVCGDQGALALIDGADVLKRWSSIEVYVTNSSVENGTFYLMAHAKCFAKPMMDGERQMDVYAVINDDRRIKMDTFLSNYSYRGNQLQVGEFDAFHFELPLGGVESIAFQVEVQKYTYRTTLSFSLKQGLKAQPGYDLTDGAYQVMVKGNRFVVSKGRFFRPKPKANRKITACRMLMGHRWKRIWLYSDRHGVFDNAYYQFLNDFGRQDGIARYYIYDDELPEVEARFTKQERKRLVKFNSPQHKVLYANAEYVLTSFVDPEYFRPFDLKTFSYYRSSCFAKVVYLQHGILHTKALHYHKERLEIDKVVISGAYERELFVESCDFRPKDLIECGMPRLDRIDRDREPERKILYAPSWRQYLTGGLTDLRWQPIPEEELERSNYYRGIVELLSDPALCQALAERGYQIEFKIHPIFEMYLELFQRDLPHIQFKSETVELERYAAFLTDYSSFLYDFAYLKRPILYYIPDIDEFNAKRDNNANLYIAPNDGLGFYSSDAREIVGEIVRLIDSGFQVDPVYTERMDRIFSSRAPTHGEALYRALMGKDPNV